MEERETRPRKSEEEEQLPYKKGGNEAVIFVPATPNSQLQRRYQRKIKR